MLVPRKEGGSLVRSYLSQTSNSPHQKIQDLIFDNGNACSISHLRTSLFSNLSKVGQKVYIGNLFIFEETSHWKAKTDTCC